MKNMKLVLERWDKYVKEEEKEEVLEEGIFKNLALALGLMFGGSAMGAQPTQTPEPAAQVVKVDSEKTDQVLNQLTEMAQKIHLFMSAKSISAAKEVVEQFKETSAGLEGIDMTQINAKLDQLVSQAINPETHALGVEGLNNFYLQMQALSNKYVP